MSPADLVAQWRDMSKRFAGSAVAAVGQGEVFDAIYVALASAYSDCADDLERALSESGDA